jgi:hypothetical protein
MVKHPMSFKGNTIQVKQHICDPKSIISYNETILDKEEAVWIGSLTATKVPDMEKIKKLVPRQYYDFMTLFGEPLAQELPPH